MRAPWQLDLLWGVVNGLGDRCGRGPARRDDREPLVRGAARPRHGRADRQSTATGKLIFLPALAAIADACGLALRRGDRERGRVRARRVPLVASCSCATAPPTSASRLRRDRDRAAVPRRAQPVRGAATSLADGARSSRDFWLLAGSFFICGLSTNGLIGTHLIPAAMDHGYGEVDRRRAARDDRRLRHRRHDVLGLADRPLRPARPALLVLRPARPLAARAAVRLRLAALRPDPVHRLLRARLGRDRAADRRADRGDLRPRAGRRHLRLDLLLAHVRRRCSSVGRRRRAHVVRRVRLGVRDGRPAVPVRVGARDADRPCVTAAGPASPPRRRAASPRDRCRAARAARPLR